MYLRLCSSAQFSSFVEDPSYLETAKRAANYFIDHLLADGLPFRDLNAPYRPKVTPGDSSSATIAASSLLMLQQQLNRCGRSDSRQNYTRAAIRLVESAVNLALAGEISFADVDANNPHATLGANTNIATPANMSRSQGFESILMHGTANNNPDAGDRRSFDTGLVDCDYYLLEAGNRLLEMQDVYR